MNMAFYTTLFNSATSDILAVFIGIKNFEQSALHAVSEKRIPVQQKEPYECFYSLGKPKDSIFHEKSECIFYLTSSAAQSCTTMTIASKMRVQNSFS